MLYLLLLCQAGNGHLTIEDVLAALRDREASVRDCSLHVAGRRQNVWTAPAEIDANLVLGSGGRYRIEVSYHGASSRRDASRYLQAFNGQTNKALYAQARWNKGYRVANPKQVYLPFVPEDVLTAIDSQPMSEVLRRSSPTIVREAPTD